MKKDAYEELYNWRNPSSRARKRCPCNGDLVKLKTMRHIFASFKGNCTSDTTYIREDDKSGELKRLTLKSIRDLHLMPKSSSNANNQEALAYFDKMIAEDPKN